MSKKEWCEKMEIVQEMGKSYLCIDASENSEYTYLERMLTDNTIKGQPICRKGIYQNKDMLKYDITNMKNLKREYDSRSMHFEDLSGLLYGIAEQLETGSAYLLDEELYVYDPEYMFIDMETGKLNLICIPYECEENGSENRFHKLAEFILEKIDHKEENTVSIAYQFYRMSKEKLFSVIGFCSLIEKEAAPSVNKNPTYKRESETLSVPGESSDPFTGYDQDSSFFESSYSEKDKAERTSEKSARQKSFLLPGGIGIIALIVTGIYLKVGKKSPYNIQILSAVVILYLSSVILGIREIVDKLNDKKEKEIEKDMSVRPVSVNDYWGGDERTVFFDEETQFFDQTEREKYSVEWSENGEERREIVDKKTVVLGKKFDEVDVYVSDPTVSRRHAKLTIRSGDIYLQDLGSTNGTFVDGVRIDPGEDIKLCNNKDFLLGKVAVRVV